MKISKYLALGLLIVSLTLMAAAACFVDKIRLGLDLQGGTEPGEV